MTIKKFKLLPSIVILLLLGTLFLQPQTTSAATNQVKLENGLYHSLALKEDGNVWAWGYNGHGELGDGTVTSKKLINQVKTISGVTSIAAGYYHNAAVKGDGTVTLRKTPVTITNIANVGAIAAGASHSVALLSDGTVWACGQNNYGQLGDGTVTTRKTPVQVKGLANVKAIAAGVYHSIALMNDGTVWAWGLNSSGQLGDATVTKRTMPVPVRGLTIGADIASGGYHNTVLNNDDSVMSWGMNKYGQLGDGTVVLKKVAVKVIGLRIVAVNDVFDPTDPVDPDDPGVLQEVDQDLIDAQNAVAYAENLVNADLGTEILVNSAQQFKGEALAVVNALPEGALKSALVARLDLLQKFVDAFNLLNTIIKSKLLTFEQVDQAIFNLKQAKAIIDSLPSGQDKTTLTELYQKAEGKILQDLLNLLAQKSTGKPILLSDQSLELLVKYAIQKVGAVSTQARGKVMGFVMPIVNNRATGQQVNQIIDRLLPAIP